MYEAEVKSLLVKNCFNPSENWEVNIHLDPMELCRGGTHPQGKREACSRALEHLKDLGVNIGVDRMYKVDVSAKHPDQGLFLIEVKGESSEQKEVGLYSALGQLITKAGEPPWNATLGLAFPNTIEWERQIKKLPIWLIEHISLRIYLVSEDKVLAWNKKTS